MCGPCRHLTASARGPSHLCSVSLSLVFFDSTYNYSHAILLSASCLVCLIQCPQGPSMAHVAGSHYFLMAGEYSAVCMYDIFIVLSMSTGCIHTWCTVDNAERKMGVQIPF